MHKQISAPSTVPGQSTQICLCLCVFSFPEEGPMRLQEWAFYKRVFSAQALDFQERKLLRRNLRWGIILHNPNPQIQGKTNERKWAPKLPSLPCFKAFRVTFLSICLPSYVGGWGVTSAFLRCVCFSPDSWGSFLLTARRFLLVGGGNRKQKRPNQISGQGGNVSRGDPNPTPGQGEP